MTEPTHSWNFDELSTEARRTAEKAAEAAGMELDIWLNQLIKYVSAMELKGEAPAGDNGFDKAIEAMATADFADEERVDEAPGAPPKTHPFEDRQPDDLLPGEKAWPGDGIAPGNDIKQESGAPSESYTPPQSDPLAQDDPLADDWGSAGEAAGNDEPPPNYLSPDLLSPSRFEEEPPHERDIESAIGGWRKTGSLVPVVVRPDRRETDARESGGQGKQRYEIVTGAERWQAAKRLKMKQVPVAVTSVSDEELLRVNLIERLRRRSLSPVEEARTYRRILTKTAQSVVGLASDIGCAPSQITSALQLLELPEPVQAMIEDGKLTVLHARALLQADDPEAVAGEVVARRLDIYQTEQLVRNPHTPPVPHAEPDLAKPDFGEPDFGEPHQVESDERDAEQSEPEEDRFGADTHDAGRADENPHEDDAEIRMIEKNLSSLLGIRVSIEGGDVAGVLSLHYGGEGGLRDLVLRLNREPPRS